MELENCEAEVLQFPIKRWTFKGAYGLLGKKRKHILEIRAMLRSKNAHQTFCLKNEYATLDFVLMKLKNRDILNVRN